MSTLNEFISYVKSDGIAKTSHFKVLLPLPEKLANSTEFNMQKVMLFCDQAAIPGTSLGTAPVRSYGELKEVPYEKLYEPITLSFYVDATMTVKYLFDSWMALIQNPGSRDFSYPREYQTTVEIFVENMEGTGVYSCKLFNCYLKAIAPIQLDYAGKDAMKMSVTLSYQYATTELHSVNKKQSNVEETFISNVMEDFNYGFDNFSVIPQSYFDEFNSFQSQIQNFDFSFGGVGSIEGFEDVGQFTGFGGIFV